MPLALINLIMFLHARQTLSQLLRHKQQAAAAAAVAAVGNTPQRNNVAQPLTVAPRFHTAGCHSRHGGAGWSNGFVTPPDFDKLIQCLHARQTLSQLLHQAAAAAAAAAAVANTWQRNSETQPLAVAPRFHTAGCHSRRSGAWIPNCNAFVMPPIVCKPTKLFIT